MGAHGVHDWRPRGDGAAAQVIAVRKAAGKHRKIGAGGQAMFAMPDDGRFFARDFLDGADRVLLTIRAWEQNDGGFHVPVIFSSLIAACPGNPPLEDLHLEVFNNLVGEQFLACGAQHSLRRGWIVRSKFDLEYFSLPQAVDTGDAERFERTLYGLALPIQDTVLECDNDPRFHRSNLWLMAWARIAAWGYRCPKAGWPKPRHGRRDSYEGRWKKAQTHPSAVSPHVQRRPTVAFDHWTSFGPLARGCSFSCKIPSRLATSVYASTSPPRSRRKRSSSSWSFAWMSHRRHEAGEISSATTMRITSP